MKKLYLLASVVVMAVAVSCGGSKGGPQDVADKFMKAFLVDMNIDDARQYVSDGLKSDFPETNNMNELEKHFIQIMKDHSKTHGYKFEYNPAESETESDDAEICYIVTAKGNPDFKGEASIELEKGADGKWLVTDYDVDRDESAIDFGF